VCAPIVYGFRGRVGLIIPSYAQLDNCGACTRYPVTAGSASDAASYSRFPRVRACGADWVAVNYRLACLGLVDACKRSGIGVVIWTVDAESLISRTMANDKIDVLITNLPKYAVARRAELRATGPA
jgi:glycerophosphoryl diester phosphodiesterase